MSNNRRGITYSQIYYKDKLIFKGYHIDKSHDPRVEHGYSEEYYSYDCKNVISFTIKT
jgi:hypothetical protein